MKDEKYQEAFGESVDRPLTVFLRCVEIMRKVDGFLAAQSISKGHKTNVKFYVGCLVARKLLESSDVEADRLVEAKARDITDGKIAECFQRVWSEYEALLSPA